MVAGFDLPEGNPGALRQAVTTLGTIHADLVSRTGTIRTAYADTLEAWNAPRSDKFRKAGAGVDKTLTGSAGLLDGLKSAVDDYEKTLRTARAEVRRLHTLAKNRQTRAEERARTLTPDQAELEWQHANTAISGWRADAEEQRTAVRSKGDTVAGNLDGILSAIIPGAQHLTPDQVGRRVHASFNVDKAQQAMKKGELTAGDAWEALPGGEQKNLIEKFLDQWGGFKPPEDGDPVAWTNYVLGQTLLAGGSTVDYYGRVKYGRFQLIGPDGRTVSMQNMTFWDRLKAGTGRFPHRAGMTSWQRLRGFDPDGHWRAKPHGSGPRAQWGTAGKWLNRGGGVLTFGASAYDEWHNTAGMPTDERVGQTTVKATTQLGGALVGAKVGGTLGAAIGTAIFPGAGTVVGGLVGGLVGGFIGSEVGGWLGDKIKGGGAWVGDKVGDLVDGADEVLEDVGDTLSDVGDTLSFWD